MKNKAVMRSIVIISILLLSILCGLLFQLIWDAVDRVNYPQDYSDFVEVYAYKYGVPEYVVYSVIKVESNFESGAVSEAGAVGLMQLMPETFVWLTTENGENLNSATLYDPETNIKYGTYYLSQLYLRFGTWDEVYAAYNAGPTKVDEWLESKEYSENGKTLDEIPYKETEKYVKKLNKANDIYKKLYYED
ncbi:MAG: lytic transglycosylase domain-containing protein [Ruminococcaceae bacterium]|nr:lytic transglycosylase domain-containing protein [Oscillospiraceae bacterium]